MLDTDDLRHHTEVGPAVAGTPHWIDSAAPDELRAALRKEMEDCHDMARRFVHAIDQRNDARTMLRRVLEHEDARGYALFGEALEVLDRTGNNNTTNASLEGRGAGFSEEHPSRSDCSTAIGD